MDKKSKIINSILLLIMFASFLCVSAYVLIYIYDKFNFPIFNGETIKSNIGDIVIFFGVPIYLLIFGIYKYFLKLHYKLVDKEEFDKEKEDID